MSHLRHTVIRWLPARLRHALRAWNSSRQVRHFTEERWPEAAVVRQLIRPGDVVVDAGANIGYLSALLARWVGPSGLVHSIEPIPRPFSCYKIPCRSWDSVRFAATTAGSRIGPETQLWRCPPIQTGRRTFMNHTW